MANGLFCWDDYGRLVFSSSDYTSRIIGTLNFGVGSVAPTYLDITINPGETPMVFGFAGAGIKMGGRFSNIGGNTWRLSYYYDTSNVPNRSTNYGFLHFGVGGGNS